MTRSLTRSRRSLAGLVPLGLTTAALLAATSGASADAGVVTCHGSLDFRVNGSAVAGTGTLSGCSDPRLNSAMMTMTGTEPVQTALETDIITTDTITLTNGQTATFTEARTLTGLGQGVEAGTGVDPDPVADVETGTFTEGGDPGIDVDNGLAILKALFGWG